ncbi:MULTISPECIES: rubrerythrin-like domain-containing protein [Natronorubrum]|uniref:DUF7129 domain-containing protein n=2 Tax=Natronorubrum TaxID=134813 RepID=A0A1N6XSS4_9EURY|nr:MULTISPECIES: rubrerythrin-like domain-containing protein [Natronorubrum]SEH11137.1 hypothetical protein SAMN04487967_0213 [Natronorubrum sediminis]SIR05374.1 hypothetical protein SAMN05421809_0209 [Natronorubrum daqingense]
MSLADSLEYECLLCGRREWATDSLVSTCRRCGGEMRNVEVVGS